MQIYKDKEKQEAEDILEDIFKFKKEKAQDLSIMDTIIEYAYKNDYDIQEIGNIISEHEEFKIILEKQLIRDHYIKTNDAFYEFVEDEWA
jgi:archaellum biogenesis ATPase FlaH